MKPISRLPAIAAGLGLALMLPVGATAQPAATPSLAAIIANMPKNMPRAAAPGLDEAILAARSAIALCHAKGAPISVLITDADAHPVVLLSGDGAGYRSALIAQTKANIVARYRASSADIALRAEHDPDLAAQAAADPGIGQIRAGGLPLYRHGAIAGIIAVSGASLKGGDLTLDEQCARASLNRLNRRQDKADG